MKAMGWHCKTCGKWDLANTEEQLGRPEHVSYRGIDLGNCDGKFEPIFSAEEMNKIMKAEGKP